jgi:flagellar biosynthesis protein FlhG
MNEPDKVLTQAEHKPRRAKVIAITSGKGGVGKTSLSVNLSITLNKAGLNVLLIDADMGLANVDLMTGITSSHTIEEVVDGRCSIFDALAAGPEGLTILPAGSGMGRVRDLNPELAARFRQELLKLESAFDLIFIDTGAGISANVTDFVFMADEVIIVMTPEPTAFADAYAMVKLVFAEKPAAAVGIVFNMARSDEESKRLVGKFSEVVKSFLKKEVTFHGAIVHDRTMLEAIMRQTPLAIYGVNAPAMQSIRKIARNILGIEISKPKTLFNR